ncbi:MULTISPECIES: type II toxin-antitoxin system RelE/ParE family toxin [Parabacteroides]|uniref:type II toxin-antitoxin system RelE/ParE family toxin n=1 Tax=Parabacteroides leei TaxID=2939491 RepID=UPI00189C054B|nr:type II toxin-antitoxin system RelE/ParE family toxin [Parabacteroides goldsteinii]
MEYIVKWMPIAQLDLEDIYQFYLSKSEQVANDIWNRLLESSNPLKIFAYAGPVEPFLANREKEYHSLVVEKHFKLIYYIEGNNVCITAVWDIRRDPEYLKYSIK